MDIDPDWFEGLTEEQVMFLLFYLDFHEHQEIA